MGSAANRRLYAAEPPDFVRYEDSDGDGVADKREVLLTGWPLSSNGTTLHGPYLGPDGWMYLTYSPDAYEIHTKEGTILKGPRGRMFRVQPDGSYQELWRGGKQILDSHYNNLIWVDSVQNEQGGRVHLPPVLEAARLGRRLCFR